VVVVTRDLGIAMRFEHKNLEKVIDQCDLQGNCGGIYLGVRWAQPKKVRQRMEAVTVAHRATRWGGSQQHRVCRVTQAGRLIQSR
jgi:hypothetical protein